MKKRIFFSVIIISILLMFSCDIRTSTNNQMYNSNELEEELVEVEEEYEDDCDNCNGSGWMISTCSSCGGTGVTYRHTTKTRAKECYKCMGTGWVRCERCGGYGYIRCQYCNGNGSFQCTVCHGYGIIVIDASRPHLSPQCNNCDGTGYEKCAICSGQGRIKCCNNGLTQCPVCWGSGTYGMETYSESEIIRCSNCNGSGYVSNWCYNCNGTGKVKKTRIVQKKRSEL